MVSHSCCQSVFMVWQCCQSILWYDKTTQMFYCMTKPPKCFTVWQNHLNVLVCTTYKKDITEHSFVNFNLVFSLLFVTSFPQTIFIINIGKLVLTAHMSGHSCWCLFQELIYDLQWKLCEVERKMLQILMENGTFSLS
jgi:hypothetical protein